MEENVMENDRYLVKMSAKCGDHILVKKMKAGYLTFLKKLFKKNQCTEQ